MILFDEVIWKTHKLALLCWTKNNITWKSQCFSKMAKNRLSFSYPDLWKKNFSFIVIVRLHKVLMDSHKKKLLFNTYARGKCPLLLPMCAVCMASSLPFLTILSDLKNTIWNRSPLFRNVSFIEFLYRYNVIIDVMSHEVHEYNWLDTIVRAH